MSQHKCARAMFFVYFNCIITVFVSYFKAVGFIFYLLIFLERFHAFFLQSYQVFFRKSLVTFVVPCQVIFVK